MADQSETQTAHNQTDEQDGSGGDDNDNGHEGKNPECTSIWEWLVGLVGLVLVLGSIGFMGYEAINGDDSPPDIKLYVKEVSKQNNGYLVQFTAENQGGSTAAGLQVEGELKKNDQPVVSSQTTFDYVPAHSQRRGGLFFDRNPKEFQIELRAVGYQEP